MGEGQSAIVLPTQQFIGFWGIGVARSALDTVIELGLIEPFAIIQSGSGSNQDEGLPASWGVVLGGMQGQSDRDIPNHTPVVVGTSASGLGVDTASFDAVVRLEGNRLRLQRDPFGRFPLYWLHQEQVIWFSSRWQWLVALRSQQNIDLAAVYGYACFSYIPTPLTPVAGIANLPAATRHTWTLSPSQATLSPPTSEPTWQWQETPHQMIDEVTAIAQLRSRLQQSIQSQISDLQDEPVGVFLSGGLDSSIVAALLVQSGLKVRAYTLDFGEAGISEAAYAEHVAAHLNIPLVRVDATPRQIRRALIPTAQALDLPFGDSVTVPLYLLGAAARQEVSVVFNGEGGDQLFAGWTNKPLIAAEIYQAEQPQADSFTQQYLRTFHRLWGYEPELFQPQVLPVIQSLNPCAWLQTAIDQERCPSLLHRLRRATLMLKGAQNIQPRATHLGLAHGLKVRSPFCALPLATWAFQVSSELHLRGSCEKYILKRVVEDWLPAEIVWRTKRGMGVPLTTWCFHELWHDLGTWLNPAQLQQDGIWQPQIANRIVTGQLGTIQGRRIGECLWLLLMWQVWQQAALGVPLRSPSFNHPFWLPAPIGQLYCRLRKQFY
jgi:asparagine synthase (glutamine-hydrolysing)